MKKFRIALLSIIILAILCAGFYFIYPIVTNSNNSGLGNNKKRNNLSSGLTDMQPVENQADIYDNLDYAIKKNSDAVAWLEVPETDINNIVMQGDDNDYYLRRNEDKKDDIYGCYFADYECALGKYDDFLQNTIIYGHSDSKDNPDGKRFAQLHRFNDPEFAKKVPYVYVSTPEGRYKFEIFSAFYTQTNFDYIKVNISDKEKLALANKAKELSIHDYGIKPDLSDKLLTLSTCTVKYGSEKDYRFVIMARLCPYVEE